MKHLLFILSILISFSSLAQTATRGPYLQTPTDNSIIIMWRTDVATDSRVQVSTSPTFSSSQTVLNSANVTDHTVEITGLSPYTKYYYRVGTTTAFLAGPVGNTYI